MNQVAQFLPEIFSIILIVVMAITVFWPVACIPRHGGDAYDKGYQLCDNPYSFDTDKAMLWHTQWLVARGA